jgi:hypothetical protein
MGWSSGSRLASELIELVRDTFEDSSARETFYEEMIAIFEDHDCDTLDECVGVDSAFDAAWDGVYGYDEDEEKDDE